MTNLVGCDRNLFQTRTMPIDSAVLTKRDACESRRNVFTISPVRITYIIDQLCNIRSGGELALLRIIRHLPRDRFQPSVVTFKVKPSSAQIVQDLGCPLHVFPIQRTYDWVGFTTALKLRSLLAVKGPSIVHTFFETSNIWGGLITKLSFGPMLVSSRRDMGILRSTKHHLAYKLINVLSDRVLTVSNEVRRLCIEQEGIRESKLSTVYNGVDLSCVDSAEDRFALKEKLGIHRASHVITTVANIRRVKGLDVFIKAAAIVHSRFKSAVFLIAGWPNEPQYFDELRQLVIALGLQNHVYFLGEVEDVFPILKHSDVFCLLSRTEGFSNALLEAMACRLPCVATRVGGNAEVIDDGSNGYLVPDEDPKAAAERVTMLLESRERAREIGHSARRTIEARFTVEIMIDQLTKLYTNLLAARYPTSVSKPNVAQAEPSC